MIILIAIAWFALGLLTYYTMAYAGAGWYVYWYLWDKGNYVLLFLSLCYPVNPAFRYVFRWLTVFATIRFIWEIISLTTGKNVNNTRIMALFFMVLIGIICAIIIKELVKWRKQNLRQSS
jgi:hypothetical protein